MTTSIYTALPTLELNELEELAAEIKSLIEELKEANQEPINVGDVVNFDVKGLTVTGVVASQTAKRSKVHATLVEGSIQIATKSLELLESQESPESQESQDL